MFPSKDFPSGTPAGDLREISADPNRKVEQEIWA